MLGDIINKSNDFCVIGEAGNGLEAIKKYEELQPDVVTMDITMPELTGLDAVKSIKEKHPEAKIVMCSAMGQQAMVLEAIRNGACDFIVKPFQAGKVLEVLRRATV